MSLVSTAVRTTTGVLLGAVVAARALHTRDRPGDWVTESRAADPGTQRAAGRVYPLSLVASSLFLPGLAGVLAVVLHVRDDGSGPRTFGVATGAALTMWLIALWLPFQRFTRVDGASPTTYGQTGEALTSLRHRPGARAGEAHAQLEVVAADLRTVRAELRWLLQTGYVDLWRRLHRAEEALIAAARPAEVVAGALHDESRLQGSKIAQRDELIARLRRMIKSLGDPAAAYLVVRPDAPASPVKSPRPEVQEHACAVARQVRRTINEFRDDRREGLVRARNNLAATVLLTGTTSYLLLGLALVGGASGKAVAAGATFYLVGAIVGLFRQLRVASDADTVTEEDYGLYGVRLVHTPLFSGLAAVGGVVLVALLPTTVPAPDRTGADARPGLTATVTEAQEGSGSGEGRAEKSFLAETFDLDGNAQALLIAAIFGLTPNLLITRLQRQVEKYKDDLRSSEAAERSAEDANR